jgi:hypothetical protein
MRQWMMPALAGLLLACSTAMALAQPPPRPPGQRPPAAQPQAGPAFTLRNEGSRTLREFYASSPQDNDWGQDRLSADMVAPGASFRVQLPRGAGCQQDLRAVFDDDTTEEKRGVDVCRERTQAFRNPEPDTEVTVVNQAPRTLFQLYFRAGGGAGGGSDWGPDRLGSGTVAAGGRETIRFSAAGQCSFDIRIVFDNDSAEERTGIDVCRTPVLVFRPGWTTAERMPGEGDAPSMPGRPARPRSAPSAGGLVVLNQGQVPIVRLAIDPPGAQAAGPDRLGDGVIGPGARLAVPPPEGLCIGDLVATFRDGGRAERRGQALCDGAEVSLP